MCQCCQDALILANVYSLVYCCCSISLCGCCWLKSLYCWSECFYTEYNAGQGCWSIYPKGCPYNLSIIHSRYLKTNRVLVRKLKMCIKQGHQDTFGNGCHFHSVGLRVNILLLKDRKSWDVGQYQWILMKWQHYWTKSCIDYDQQVIILSSTVQSWCNFVFHVVIWIFLAKVSNLPYCHCYVRSPSEQGCSIGQGHQVVILLFRMLLYCYSWSPSHYIFGQVAV